MAHPTVQNMTEVEDFTMFVEQYQSMLRNALVAVVGPDLAGDAVSEAMTYCWRHWDRVRTMDNPAGYLWSVGRSKGRDLLRQQHRASRVRPDFPPAPAASPPLVEPQLPAAFARLSERQRVAVFLIHGYGWTHSEVAGFLGVTVPTVQKHAERGLAKLQRALGTQP